MDNFHYKQQVAKTMQRLYNRGLTTCSGGNVSFKLDDETIFITASGIDKGNIEPHDIGICNINGELITPHVRLSMETLLHLSIYKKRNDVFAIVHSHPPYASAFSASSQTINSALSGEMRALLGEIAIAEYACMGSTQLAETVSESCSSANVVIMKNHGAICLGKSLFEAYDRMEVLENAAKMTFITHLLGNANSLSKNELKSIDQFFSSYLNEKQ